MHSHSFTYCPLCNHPHPVDIKGWERAHLARCKACSFIFARLIPDESTLMKHYQGYGRNDFLSPITIKRYHELLDRFEPFRKTGKILDVGCGIGYFLEEAAKRGWEVHGTEFTDRAMEICTQKGISMKQGPLNPDLYNPQSFDVITSFEVIEHINNPHTDIQHFATLLRAGGLVYITTPNFNSLSRIITGNKWNVVTYPEHLCYYTPRTLRFLFQKHGFDVMHLQTTGISISRIKISHHIASAKPVSRESDDEKIRQMAENKWYMRMLKDTANGILTLFKKGDTLKGMFVKK